MLPASSLPTFLIAPHVNYLWISGVRIAWKSWRKAFVACKAWKNCFLAGLGIGLTWILYALRIWCILMFVELWFVFEQNRNDTIFVWHWDTGGSLIRTSSESFQSALEIWRLWRTGPLSFDSPAHQTCRVSTGDFHGHLSFCRKCFISSGASSHWQQLIRDPSPLTKKWQFVSLPDWAQKDFWAREDWAGFGYK